MTATRARRFARTSRDARVLEGDIRHVHDRGDPRGRRVSRAARPSCSSVVRHAPRSRSRATGSSTSAPGATRRRASSTTTCASSTRRGRGHSCSRTCTGSRTETTTPPGSRSCSRPAEHLGYHVAERVILAADYGVPQRRQRVFVMGSLEREPEFPAPTHSGPHETRKDWDTSLPPHVTTGEAIGDLAARDDLAEPEEHVNGRYGHLLPGDPARRQLPLLHGEAGSPGAALRVALALLELPPEARPRPAVADDPGAAGPVRRPVPLGEPPAATGGDQATPDVPGRLRDRRLAALSADADRERGARRSLPSKLRRPLRAGRS